MLLSTKMRLGKAYSRPTRYRRPLRLHTSPKEEAGEVSFYLTLSNNLQNVEFLSQKYTKDLKVSVELSDMKMIRRSLKEVIGFGSCCVVKRSKKIFEQ